MRLTSEQLEYIRIHPNQALFNVRDLLNTIDALQAELAEAKAQEATAKNAMNEVAPTVEFYLKGRQRMSKVLNELESRWRKKIDRDPESQFHLGLGTCADELNAALPAVEAERKELVEALRWAMTRVDNPGVQEFGCSFCSAAFVGPNAQSDHDLKCPYGNASKQLALARVKEK